ncbi:MAG TPA: hypothetical protein V6D10_22705 [Trichocoleus sp.]|jgi:hypothetical protein
MKKNSSLSKIASKDSACVAHLYANGDLSIVKSYKNQGRNLKRLNQKNVRDSVYLINSDPRSTRGCHGISSKERRHILDGCAVLAENYNQAQLVTATLTLPPLSPNNMTKIHQNWSELLRKFIQDIKRDLKKAGLEPAVVYRTEIQEERLNEHGELALHVHLVFPNRQLGGPWIITIDRLYKIWSNKLNKLLSSHDLIPVNCVTGIEQVKDINKLASYLTKKKSEVLEQAKLLGYGTELPKSWAGASAQIRKQATASRNVIYLDLPIDQAQAVLEASDHARIGWHKKQGNHVVALCGKVNESNKEKLIDELQYLANLNCA